MNIYYWQSTVLKKQGIQYIKKTISSWKVYGLILGNQACQTRRWSACLIYVACGPPQQVWHAWARMLYILGVTNEGEKDRWENQAIEEHFPSSAFGLSPALPGELWRIPSFFPPFCPFCWASCQGHTGHTLGRALCRADRKKRDLSWRDKRLTWQAPDVCRKAFLLYKPSPVAKPLKNTTLADSQVFGVGDLRRCCQLCQVCPSEAGEWI